jgi:Pentapeptide repeats (8 copies)
MRSIPLVVGLLAAVAVVLVITWVLFVPAADWLATHDVGQVTGPARALRLQTARDAARGRLLTLGAGLFALSALVYTARNFSLSREGQVTDRYTKAIEQLGSEKLDVRIGGIYALERVARDSVRDHPTVTEVLAAFIREHSRDQRPPHLPRPDIQAAITVIGRRDSKRDRGPINLVGAYLFCADLARAHLVGADLRGVELTGATLTGANLARAHLVGADLVGVDLRGVDLTGAHLVGADLTGATWPSQPTSPPGWEREPLTGTLKRVSKNPDATAQPEA